jgi:Leucine-rich repeat (LRR) protein
VDRLLELAMFLFLILSFPPLTLAVTPPSQIEGLHFLFNSTNGASWRWKNEVLNGPSWSFSSPQPDPCDDNNKNWQGITCSSAPNVCRTQNCEIVSLVLNSFGLEGTLPPEFFLRVTSLTKLQIASSLQLDGSISPEIESLSQLQFLYLDNNQLTGTIPRLGSLSQLKSLDLNSNQLTGSLATELSSMWQLTYLYLDSNLLTGSIPTALCALSQLSYFSLFGNHLTGTIPSEFGSLSLLNYLSFDSNQLRGSVPTELSKLSQLVYLYLFENQLTGSIPSELSLLSQLKYFALYSNQFTGTIPSALGSLTLLNFFSLSSNQLTGSIPTELSSLSLLNSIDFNLNRLTGPIPEGFSSMSRLHFLYLHFNRLTGAIPSALGSLSQLYHLYLHFNRLTGAIPSALASLSQLNYLYLHSNRLTGTIPSALSSFPVAIYFSLSSNWLTGTVPPELGSLATLNYLSLSYNLLTGTIPSQLAHLTQLNYLYFYFNQLTGSIPTELAALSRLNYLSLSDNQLTGAIPPELSSLSLLKSFYLNSNQLTGSLPPTVINSTRELIAFRLSANYLTGPIPSEIGCLTSLEELDLSENSFTGPIPPSLVNASKLVRLHLYQNHLNGDVDFPLDSFPSLQQLFLQQNHLHGSLHQLFFPSSLLQSHPLLNLDVSDNRFTGSIPSQLFLLPQLQSISLSLNCFEQELPSSMCEARGVEVISMSGLGSSKSCKNLVTVPFTSVSLVQTMDGSIPDCVWLLSNLKMLNLAGNGLSGTIETSATSPSLLSLTLSHNYLTGMIPLWLQERNMSQLDLSHNKLTGTLDGFKNQNKEFHAKRINVSIGEAGTQIFPRTLKLSVNRLSGVLPHSSFKKYATLDILSGNLFGCDHVPSNDKNSDWTICGSEEFDQSLIGLGGVCGVLVMCVAFYFVCWLLTLFNHSPLSRSVGSPPRGDKGNSLIWFERRLLVFRTMIQDANYSSRQHLPYPSIRSFGSLLSNLSKSLCSLTLLSLTLSVPIYVLKVLDVESQQQEEQQTQYVTHSHLYRWLWTTAFISGTVPSILLMLVTLVCLLSLCWFLHILRVNNSSDREINPLSPHGHPNHQDAAVPTTLLVWVILFINIAVVGAVNGLYLWSTLLDLSTNVRFFIQFAFGFFIFAWRSLVLRRGLPVRLKESQYGVWLFACLNVVNMVLIPCVVTALSNPSCYQRLLIPPDDITSSYSYQECSVIRIESAGDTSCLLYTFTIMDPLQITPPFSYSYQCGSTILVSYIPVYLYSVSLQLVSLFMLLGIALSSCSLPEAWLTRWISPIQWPLPLLHKLLDKRLSQGRPPSSRLLDPHQIVSNVVSNTVLLLSFGLCSPVLACYITLSTCVTGWCWSMLVGRFVACRLHDAAATLDPCAANPTSLARDPEEDKRGEVAPGGAVAEDPYLTHLEHQLRGVDSSLVVCKWPIISTSCFFVTMLCWDMVGDEVGWEKGLWVPVAGVLTLLILWIWDRLLLSKVIDLGLIPPHDTLLSSTPSSAVSPPPPPSLELVESALHFPASPSSPAPPAPLLCR